MAAATATDSTKWEIGQTVEVQSRTWAGINKEGGCGRITHIHYSEDGVHVEALDVKYVLTGRTDASIDPAIVSAFNTLQRGGRKRRGRDFLMEMEQPQPQQAQENKPPAASKKKKATTSDNKEALATTKAASKPSVKKQKNDSKAPKSTIRKQSTTTKEVKKSATAKRRIVPVAAAESSPRSTATEESSSTPPSKKRTTKAKKATPIPSLVIADPGKIQVSPLPVHGERPTVAKKKKTNNNDLSSSSTTTNNKVVAKRGLFGSGHNSKNKNTNKEAGAQGHQLQRKKSTSSKGVSVTAAAKKPLATEIGDGDDGDSLFEDIARMQRKNPVVHHSNDRSKNNKKKLPPNKKPRPPKQTNKSANDMPLKEVYDDEVKKASSFVKGVIQSSSTSNNTSRPIAVTTAKENNVGKSKNKIDDPVKKPPILGATSSNSTKEEQLQRYKAFLSIFQMLRMKAEDGTIEESHFRKLVNVECSKPSSSSRLSKPFSDDELDQHLEKLYEDGKVMRSSGTLYIID